MAQVSARTRSARLAQAYLAADAAGRASFLRTLAGFDADPAMLEAALKSVSEASDAPARAKALAKLRRALEAPRVRLLTQFTSIPEGVKFLVDMRAELMPLTRSDPALAALGEFKADTINVAELGRNQPTAQKLADRAQFK